MNIFSIVLFLMITALGLFATIQSGDRTFIIAFGVVGLLVMASTKMANQWEKAVILRLGKFDRLAGPGLFFVIPVIDSVTTWIDHRVMVTTFTAEQTLTKDTVPVDVDAVLFWKVWGAEQAALEVKEYKAAVSWSAQTALRDIIGRTLLSDMLADREHIDLELRKVIDQKTEPWGISVQSVEIRDVLIPPNLQDAMSREAQAERERKARIILGTAETEIAEKFAEAAKSYTGNPMALQLRAMNILYEGIKEKGALVVVPSTAVESMGGGLGAIAGLTSLAAQNGITTGDK